MDIEGKPYTTGEIAEFCHVTHRAVLKWIAAGKLKAYRTPGHHSRVREEDFLSFLAEYKMPVPAGLLKKSNKYKVLIVDDEEAMVNSIRRFLAMDRQYQLEVAFDGFTAGQKFAQFGPDLMILDIKMPKMDGYEVCRRLRSDPANKDVKILVISGIIDAQGAQRIMDLGANDYLPKPFTNEALKQKIDHLLGVRKEGAQS